MIEFLDYTSKKIKTYVNKEKKMVITIIEMYITVPGDEPTLFKKFIGKAKCMDEDKFDVKIGTKISKDRAWIKYNNTCMKIINKEIEETDSFVNALGDKLLEYTHYNQSARDEISTLVN